MSVSYMHWLYEFAHRCMREYAKWWADHPPTQNGDDGPEINCEQWIICDEYIVCTRSWSNLEQLHVERSMRESCAGARDHESMDAFDVAYKHNVYYTHTRGKPRSILKQTSTWHWMLSNAVYLKIINSDQLTQLRLH